MNERQGNVRVWHETAVYGEQPESFEVLDESLQYS